MAEVTEPTGREITWTIVLLYLVAFGIVFWLGAGDVMVALAMLPFLETAPLVALLIVMVIVAIVVTVVVVVACWILHGRP